jgi:hypothetical protein
LMLGLKLLGSLLLQGWWTALLLSVHHFELLLIIRGVQHAILVLVVLVVERVFVGLVGHIFLLLGVIGFALLLYQSLGTLDVLHQTGCGHVLLLLVLFILLI